MKIPRAQRTEKTPGGDPRNIAIAGAEAFALSSVAGTASDILYHAEEQRRKIRQANELTTALTSIESRWQEIEQDGLKIQNPEEYGQKVTSEWEKSLEQIEGNLSKDTLEIFNPRMIEADSRVRLRIQSNQLKKYHEFSIKNADSALETFGNKALEGSINTAHDMVQSGRSVIRGMGAAGVFSADQARGHEQKFVETTYWNRFLREVQRDPFAVDVEKIDWLTNTQKLKARDILDKERASLVAKAAGANKEQEQIDYIQAKLDSGQRIWWKDKDDKEAADTYYRRVFVDATKDLPAPQQAAAISDLADRLGIIPKSVQKSIGIRLMSEGPDVATAADLVDRIHTAHPQLLDTMSDEDILYAKMVNSHVTAGEDPLEAAKNIRATMFSDRDKRDVLLSRYKENELAEKAMKKLRDSDLVDPIFGSPGKISPELERHFDSLMKSNYIKTGGDFGVSMSAALTTLGQRYGLTEVDGTRKLMKLPPEKVYGGVDPDTDWIGKQFGDVSKSIVESLDKTYLKSINAVLGRELNHSDLEVVSDAITEREENPSYAISLPDGNPLFTDTGKMVRWTPDYSKTDQFERRKKEAQELHREWGNNSKLYSIEHEMGKVKHKPKFGGSGKTEEEILSDRKKYMELSKQYSDELDKQGNEKIKESNAEIKERHKDAESRLYDYYGVGGG